ncbi:hypothetical protein PYJP_01520 [Pyrofollis japonicus]|uniref:hypothetical protein n=1 Tax=Pyrofollis japonicus TaxID=3060460 RepID=UPI00295ABDC3|nr:hypothetical protein [Pyrofollis japonicus]BEP16800.1 hypothetical protein PYJP_01520 [Pyrofollis japonicus]
MALQNTAPRGRFQEYSISIKQTRRTATLWNRMGFLDERSRLDEAAEQAQLDSITVLA